MKKLRDPASHRDYETHLPAIRKVLFAFFEARGSEVARIVTAREAVKGRAKEVKRMLEAR